MYSPTFIAVAAPFPIAGGGSYRALLALRHYANAGMKPLLILPYMSLKYFQHSIIETLRAAGVVFLGYSRLKFPAIYQLPLSGTIGNIVPHKLIELRLKSNTNLVKNIEFVLSFHEVFDSMLTTFLLSKKFNVKVGAILQLPPFYGNRIRAKNVRKARAMWLKTLYGIKGRLAYYFIDFTRRIVEKRTMKIIRKFDILIAVSKSIPYEMGLTSSTKLYVLDPGVALNQEDLKLINEIRQRQIQKKNIVVFFGKAAWSKGLLDALMAWKIIVKKKPGLKLFIPGRVEYRVLIRLEALLKRMGLKDTVFFTGYLPRDKLFKLIASAKAIIYPSHVDAYPFAVLESLCLGSPVVGYDIPALKLNFSHVSGIILVKEFDVETLATEVLNVIEKGCETECPQCKTWDEVMSEEITIVKTLLDRD